MIQNANLIDDNIVKETSKLMKANRAQINDAVKEARDAVSEISESALIDLKAIDEPVAF